MPREESGYGLVPDYVLGLLTGKPPDQTASEYLYVIETVMRDEFNLTENAELPKILSQLSEQIATGYTAKDIHVMWMKAAIDLLYLAHKEQ